MCTTRVHRHVHTDMQKERGTKKERGQCTQARAHRHAERERERERKRKKESERGWARRREGEEGEREERERKGRGGLVRVCACECAYVCVCVCVCLCVCVYSSVSLRVSLCAHASERNYMNLRDLSNNFTFQLLRSSSMSCTPLPEYVDLPPPPPPRELVWLALPLNEPPPLGTFRKNPARWKLPWLLRLLKKRMITDATGVKQSASSWKTQKNEDLSGL